MFLIVLLLFERAKAADQGLTTVCLF